MATPKKSPNKATKAKTTQPNSTKTTVKQPEASPNGSRRTIFIVVATLAALFVFGYFGLGLNPFETEDSDGSQQGNDKVVTTTDKNKTDTKDKEGNADKPGATDAVQLSADQTKETVATESDEAYNYQAGTGESFTTLARRAIAQADSGLSAAERVAAETKLAQDANAELLETGQDVELAKSDVKAAIDWAKSLSDDAKAAWQPYADQVAW